MARTEKLTVDYYPHYMGKKTMFVIEQKYGNDGYAFIHKNFELLSNSDFHFMDITEKATLEYNAAKCNITIEKYLEIVALLVNLGTYDKDLYEEFGILFSQKFVENIADAYRNRKTKFVKADDLKDILRKKCKKNTENKITYVRNSLKDIKSVQSYVRNTQIKENKIKEKEIIPPIPPVENFNLMKKAFPLASFSHKQAAGGEIIKQTLKELEDENEQKYIDSC